MTKQPTVNQQKNKSFRKEVNKSNKTKERFEDKNKLIPKKDRLIQKKMYTKKQDKSHNLINSYSYQKVNNKKFIGTFELKKISMGIQLQSCKSKTIRQRFNSASKKSSLQANPKQKIICQKNINLLQRLNELTEYNELDWFKELSPLDSPTQYCHLQKINTNIIKEDVSNFYAKHFFEQNSPLQQIKFNFQSLQNYFICFNISQDHSLKAKLIKLVQKSKFFQQSTSQLDEQNMKCNLHIVCPFKKTQTRFQKRNLNLNDCLIKKNVFQFIKDKKKFQLQYVLNQETLILQKNNQSKSSEGEYNVRFLQIKFKFDISVTCQYDEKTHKGTCYIKRSICKGQFYFISEYSIQNFLQVKLFQNNYFCYLRKGFLFSGILKEQTKKVCNSKIKFAIEVSLESNFRSNTQKAINLNFEQNQNKEVSKLNKLQNLTSIENEEMLLCVTVDCQIILFCLYNQEKQNQNYKKKINTRQIENNLSKKQKKNNSMQFKQIKRYRVGVQIEKLVYLKQIQNYLYFLGIIQAKPYLIKLLITNRTDLEQNIIYDLEEAFHTFHKNNIQSQHQHNAVLSLINGYKKSKIKDIFVLILSQHNTLQHQETQEKKYKIWSLKLFRTKDITWKPQIQSKQLQQQSDSLQRQKQTFKQGVFELEQKMNVKMDLIYEGFNQFIFQVI